MKQKINIAQLLKDCPQGMELDCTMYDNLYFDLVDNYYNDTINCYTLIDGIRTSITFTKYGTYNNHTRAKCVIFPKGKTTWEGFVPFCQFKDGDIVATSNGLWIGITTSGESNSFIPTYCVIKHNGEFEAYLDKKQTWQFYRLATEEEKEKLFDAIKTNGYKWNLETKTLEKLIELKFKVGDRIKQIGSPRCYIIQSIEFDRYILHNNQFLRFGDEHIYELVPNKSDYTMKNTIFTELTKFY